MIQPSYRRVSPLRLVSEEIFTFLILATICLVILLIFDNYNALFWTIIGILSFIALLNIFIFLSCSKYSKLIFFLLCIKKYPSFKAIFSSFFLNNLFLILLNYL